jgi:hypothetical protein
MKCWEIPLLGTALVGLASGFLAYLAFGTHFRSIYERDAAESAFCGVGIGSGLHLGYSAFCPAQLVHLIANGYYVHLNELFVKDGNQFRHVELILIIDGSPYS